MPSRRLLPLVLILGCARAPRTAALPDAPPRCMVTEPAGAPADTVAVVLGEPVDPAHTPLPANDAEALIFRQLYETLVRVDCEGNVGPALALAWRADGAQWTFTLRPDAAFRDGSPLDATTLLEAWRTTNPATLVSGVRSDGRELAVFLAAPQPVTYFASPALRVTRGSAESPWPMGTGPWEPLPDAGGSLLHLASGTGRARRVLRFELRPVADPRDLLDAAAHVVVTRDRGALDYAAGLPGWTRVPLGWDRLYLLLSPMAGGADSAAAVPIREALARDALRGEARPADPALAGWLRQCSAASNGEAPADGPVRRRVVYPRADPVARALAERLVARAEFDLSTLLGAPAVTPGTTVTAAGLDGEASARALTDRNELAVVMPLRHHWAGDCGPLASLGQGWGLVVPLVETRATALIRGNAARMVTDRDGLVMEPAGPRR